MFDHSSGHTHFTPDAFMASQLNKKPGGYQPAMRFHLPQKLVMEDATPKGAAMILEERGIDCCKLKLNDIYNILAKHKVFRSALEILL